MGQYVNKCMVIIYRFYLIYGTIFFRLLANAKQQIQIHDMKHVTYLSPKQQFNQ